MSSARMKATTRETNRIRSHIMSGWIRFDDNGTPCMNNPPTDVDKATLTSLYKEMLAGITPEINAYHHIIYVASRDIDENKPLRPDLEKQNNGRAPVISLTDNLNAWYDFYVACYRFYTKAGNRELMCEVTAAIKPILENSIKKAHSQWRIENNELIAPTSPSEEKSSEKAKKPTQAVESESGSEEEELRAENNSVVRAPGNPVKRERPQDVAPTSQNPDKDKEQMKGTEEAAESAQQDAKKVKLSSSTTMIAQATAAPATTTAPSETKYDALSKFDGFMATSTQTIEELDAELARQRELNQKEIERLNSLNATINLKLSTISQVKLFFGKITSNAPVATTVSAPAPSLPQAQQVVAAPSSSVATATSSSSSSSPSLPLPLPPLSFTSPSPSPSPLSLAPHILRVINPSLPPSNSYPLGSPMGSFNSSSGYNYGDLPSGAGTPFRRFP